MDSNSLFRPNVITSKSSDNSKPSFFQRIRSPFSKLPSVSKKPLVLGLTMIMIFALVLGVYLLRKPTQLIPHASDTGVSISLKPGTINTPANQEFQVDVFVDTGTTDFRVTAVQVKINYDPAVLELKNVTLKDFLPPLLQPQNSSGTSKFAVGIPLGGTPKLGAGNIATLTFKRVVSGASDLPSQTQITFDNLKTIIAATGQTTNIARDFTPTTINFGDSASPSPVSTPPSPETSFTLLTAQGPTTTVSPNQEFAVKVYSRSDIDSANLWNAAISFPKDLVEVVRFDKTESFVTNWAEEFFSNSTGEISLTGGVLNPGLKTSSTNSLMTTIIFKAKATPGSAPINLIDTSAIYKNSDNAKITPIKRNATITISGTAVSPSPSSMPSKGDGNNDGAVNLQDLSILFSKWSPAADITGFFKLDFNDDKRLNSLDYSQLIQLLAELGIVKK